MAKGIIEIEIPISCDKCFFGGISFHHPFWCKIKPDKKGVYCQLDPNRAVTELHIDDKTYRSVKCPIKAID